jgi:NAD(P)H-nitrite reductase large subunit
VTTENKMMKEKHYVIIGNGTAGNTATKVLRQNDKNSRITLISSEPTHFLFRHTLADFLVEEKDIYEYSVKPYDWYREQNIRLRLNQPVVNVNPQKKQILFLHREKINYDKLLICSGAVHRVPEYLSHYVNLISLFSNSIDAIFLKSKLKKINHVALIGGDCIGLQLSGALLRLGKKITIVMDEYRFWPLEFDDDIKNRLATALKNKGIEVLHDDYVTYIERDKNSLLLKTNNGKKLITDEAILCSGMKPNIEFLLDSGLDLNEGILVNDKLETNVENIWAAGECSQIYYPEIKDYRCSTGYENAIHQGEIAAKNMLGGSHKAKLSKKGSFIISGEKFETYGWKGFSLDA